MNWSDRYANLNMERTAAAALVHQASDTSALIRARLAIAARDIRKAALQQGLDAPRLFAMARKLEQHAGTGDTQ